MPRTKRGIPYTRALRRRLRSAMTPAESRMWLYLRGEQFHGLKFRRQHGIGSFIVDFFCPEKQLAIEIDGDVHSIPQQTRRDEERDAILKETGLRIVRYRNDDVINNINGVLEDLGTITGISTSPNPSLQRRGGKL